MQNAPAMLAQKMMNRQAPYAPVGMVSQNMSGNKKGGAGGGAAAGLLGLAFDPATASAGIVLTNNNTTASNPSGPLNIYSAKAKTSGTAVGVVAGYYCEFVVGSASDCFLGIAAATFDTAYPNRVGLTSGIAYRNTTGEVFAAGSTVLSGLPTATTGDVIGIKFNVTATSSSFTVLKNNVVIVNAYNSTAVCPNNSTSFVPVWSSNAIGAIGTISNSVYSAPGYIPFTTDGTSALISASASVPAVADGAYDVYTFNASGTFTVASTGAVRALVIAGGGGTDAGGGSGAGGYQEKGSVVTPQTYTITVGGGGSGTSAGANSAFGASLTSTGGGSGTVFGSRNGGSGGGAYQDSGLNIVAGTGIAGQGFAGGTVTFGGGATAYSHAGGGGAGAVGGNGALTAGGNGGAGLTSSITGTAVARGGGGGGHSFDGATDYAGSATAGGGFGFGANINGTANTGGGAGPSGLGGSGVVIIRVRARA